MSLPWSRLLQIWILFTVLLMGSAVTYAVDFIELPAPESRRLLYRLPENFNGIAVIFFHGATGNAQVLLNDAPTADIIQKMLNAGFLVILPEARQNFKVGPYKASWESNTQINPDTKYIDWIINAAHQALPIKEIYVMGGSNGVSMASRIVKNHTDIAGMVAMNGFDADQFSVNADGSLLTNTTFNIPANHAPLLMISSKGDGAMGFADQQVFLKKVRQAGISAMMIVNETAGHNWGDWTIQYHDDMIGWIKK